MSAQKYLIKSVPTPLFSVQQEVVPHDWSVHSNTMVDGAPNSAVVHRVNMNLL